MLVVLLNIKNLGGKIFMVGKQHCAVLVIASRSQASKPLVWSKHPQLQLFSSLPSTHIRCGPVLWVPRRTLHRVDTKNISAIMFFFAANKVSINLYRSIHPPIYLNLYLTLDHNFWIHSPLPSHRSPHSHHRHRAAGTPPSTWSADRAQPGDAPGWCCRAPWGPCSSPASTESPDPPRNKR